MDSVMCVARVGDLFTFINVFAGNAVPREAQWTPAAPERAVGEAAAPCSPEAWAGQTTVWRGEELTLKIRIK